MNVETMNVKTINENENSSCHDDRSIIKENDNKINTCYNNRSNTQIYIKIIPVTTTEVVSILIKLLLTTIPVTATEDANKQIPVLITEKNTITMIPSFQMMNMQE